MSTTDRRGDEESTVGSHQAWEPGSDLPDLRLLVLSQGSLSSHALPRSGAVVIGRHRSAEVRVAHQSVSRRHALLQLEKDRLTVRDLESQNGTTVNGERLASGADRELGPGDVVRVGSVTLLFQPVAEGSALAPRVAQPEAPELEGVFVGEWLTQIWPVVSRIAAGDIPVLLMGETGVGKEVLVSIIHRRSRRASGPLVSVNCAALPGGLLESELFGHERGAFTGATATKKGTIASAHGGTLFLDEVGDLPLPLQSKLLRVLETREYRRVGGTEDLSADVRVIAATNRDLEAAAETGEFRKDLLFRINAFSLIIPPLRERSGEIEGLVRLFVRSTAESNRVPTPAIEPEVFAALARYDWPGNVRELRNVVSRAVLLCDGGPMTVAHLSGPVHGPTGAALAATAEGQSAPGTLRDAVRDAERRRVVEALRQCGGNQTKAARLLGISRRTLVSRLDEHGLPRPRKKTDK